MQYVEIEEISLIGQRIGQKPAKKGEKIYFIRPDAVENKQRADNHWLMIQTYGEGPFTIKAIRRYLFRTMLVFFDNRRGEEVEMDNSYFTR